jgi:hypothetical protein
MIEGIKDSDDEDLANFADYLSEFDPVFVFDNEDCPICGVSIPEKTTTDKSPFVEYIHTKNESDLIEIKKKLDLLCIPMKVEKRLDAKVIESISYDYVVLIPFRCLSKMKRSDFTDLFNL